MLSSSILTLARIRFALRLTASMSPAASRSSRAVCPRTLIFASISLISLFISITGPSMVLSQVFKTFRLDLVPGDGPERMDGDLEAKVHLEAKLVLKARQHLFLLSLTSGLHLDLKVDLVNVPLLGDRYLV